MINPHYEIIIIMHVQCRQITCFKKHGTNFFLYPMNISSI